MALAVALALAVVDNPFPSVPELPVRVAVGIVPLIDLALVTWIVVGTATLFKAALEP